MVIVLENVLDGFVGKWVDITIDFHDGRTLTIKAVIQAVEKPFIIIKANGCVRALNENIIREIIPIGDANENGRC
jgi:hypothetical protein